MHNLIKTTEFFKTIDLIITPVVIADRAGKNIYFNKAFSAAIGYTMVLIPDLEKWYEAAYPDPEYRRLIREQ